MRNIRLFVLLSAILVFVFAYANSFKNQTLSTSGAPPYGVPEHDSPQDVIANYKDWKRPEGPAKIALQVGHWKIEEAPQELHRLKSNTGAEGGGKMEWEVNLTIAQVTKKILEKKGLSVEILPAIIPPGYFADVFVAIHADSHTDLSKSGFKIASSWRDFSGKASKLVYAIEKPYQDYTNLKVDPNITRNMRGYYAFSWWRYKHALHPMTTSAILETGFLTNTQDRKIIVDKPSLSAKGLAEGIVNYLEEEKLF